MARMYMDGVVLGRDRLILPKRSHLLIRGGVNDNALQFTPTLR